MPQHLANSLGSSETTLLRMATAYSMFANGGKQIKATLIDRIQDRYGRTVFRHDQRACLGCAAEDWQEQPEPEILDNRDEVMNPYTAYQITSMLEGVVQRGTGQRVKAVGTASTCLGKPVAGKTGTSNDEKDAWFIGYTPDLTVAVYLGYDQPKPMGEGSTGGELAAPIVADYMQLALKDKPATPFRVPSGVQLIPIDPNSGPARRLWRPQRDSRGVQARRHSLRRDGRHRGQYGADRRRGRHHRWRVDCRNRRTLLNRSGHPADARRNCSHRRRNQAVHRTAEEASLTLTRRNEN